MLTGYVIGCAVDRVGNRVSHKPGVNDVNMHGMFLDFP